MSNSDSGKKEFQKWIDSLDKDDRTLVDKLFIYQQQKHDSQAQLGDIRQEVRQLFEQVRWINQMNNKCPDVSYETLFDWTINYGPDLTSIPRLRSQYLNKPKTHSSSSKEKGKPSAYRAFQKKIFAEHKDLRDLGEKSKLCSKEWKALTPEQQASYN